jgi:hypothetical protein
MQNLYQKRILDNLPIVSSIPRHQKTFYNENFPNRAYNFSPSLQALGHARRKVGIFLSPYGSYPYSKHLESRFGHWQVKRESPCNNHANNCLHNTNYESPCNYRANNYLHNSNHETPCNYRANSFLHNSESSRLRQNFIRCNYRAKLYLHNSSHMCQNFLRKERTKSVRLFDSFILTHYIIYIINQPRNKTCYSLLSISLL